MTTPNELKFKRLHPKAKLPTRGTDSAAGYDLYTTEDLTFSDRTENEIHMIKYGIAVEIPEGYCGIICERSSTHKTELSQVNKMGIIDSDYRGELMTPFWDIKDYWHDDADVEIVDNDENDCSVWGRTLPAGSRIAQLVIVPIFQAEPTFVDELEDTDRGTGGFGSTGA